MYLVEGGRSHTAELLLGGLCGWAALCAFLLPYETRGRDLQSTHLQPDSGAASGGGRGSGKMGGGRRHDGSGAPEHGGSDGESDGDGEFHGVGVHWASLDSEAELVRAQPHQAEKLPLLPS